MTKKSKPDEGYSRKVCVVHTIFNIYIFINQYNPPPPPPHPKNPTKNVLKKYKMKESLNSISKFLTNIMQKKIKNPKTLKHA